jgi:hypothetical protein
MSRQTAVAFLFFASDPVRHHNQIIVGEQTRVRRNFGVAPLGKCRRSFSKGISDDVSLRRR